MKIAINGFGRIGRLLLRSMIERNQKSQTYNIVAINDLAPAPTLAHLFKYDSVFGPVKWDVKSRENAIVVDGREYPVTSVKNLAELPWRKLEAELVFESSGVFTKKEECQKHIDAGAERVILTAPAKGDVDTTVVVGVNHDKIQPQHKIISNASCTTNCLANIVKIIHSNFGIEKAQMNTIHAVTNDQKTADQIHSDLRRARASLVNIIPTSTGAARAIGLVMPELKGKIDGFATRVPVIDGSLVDLTALLKRKVTVEEINGALKAAALNELKGILGYTEDEIVSSDIVGNSCSAIVDAKCTLVTDGNLVKVVAWYDNEWGYANRCVDLAYYLSEKRLPS
ncbi:MAG: type I glyceraldehyde-3-phosphate dehydrogenase [Planctomycetes bacterium]|nr:type I glyceraldehyde-3-phosphate dehydrogenase [Planctomycetota bacterium]